MDLSGPEYVPTVQACLLCVINVLNKVLNIVGNLYKDFMQKTEKWAKILDLYTSFEKHLLQFNELASSLLIVYDLLHGNIYIDLKSTAFLS